MEADYKLCLKGAVENALKQLENPISKLDLPSIKQLNFSNIINQNHHSKAYSIEEKIQNGAFYDLTTAQVLSFEYCLLLSMIFLKSFLVFAFRKTRFLDC